MTYRIHKSDIGAVVPLIVQARVGSTRYPRKVLQPFARGLNLLEFQLERLKKAFPEAPIVVATSILPADDPIEAIAKTMGVFYFRGDEQDVLNRYARCCQQFGFEESIIRICGDNPFLQIGFLRQLMEEDRTNAGTFDYTGFSIANTPAIRTHFGFFAELVTVQTLLRVERALVEPFYREHVTSYIYESAGRFRVRLLEIEPLIPYVGSLRLTVDSPKDLENAVYIYDRLQPMTGPIDPSWVDIVSLIDNEPEIKRRMMEQIGLNQK
jgi:spore coat polysaccharide biosynthesis protein SpsF (cytidylyltransferase family)